MVLDAVLDIAATPLTPQGFDPLAGTVVVLTVRGTEPSTPVSLAWAGTRSESSVALGGDTQTELVAQPFDGCPPGGPCTIHLRLIATASDVPLAWSVTLHNAPPGTPLDFGSATEVVPAGVAGLLIEAVVGIGWALVLGLLAVVLWRRRRSRQSDV